jgi:hypothetical protein
VVDGPDQRGADGGPAMVELVLAVEAPGIPPAADLRRQLAARLADLGPDRLDVLHLVCGEFLANAKEHGGGIRAFRVGRTAEPDVLRVEVDDHNPVLPVVMPKDLEAVTGRGMFLVENLSLGWGAVAAREGKTVWAVVPCEPTTAPPIPAADSSTGNSVG